MIHPHKEINAPQISQYRVRWLYHSDFYDGPMTGMVLVEYNGYWRELWAKMIDECDHHIRDEDDDWMSECGFYRRYQLIDLTDEAMAEQRRRHKVFQDMVGTHTDYVYDEHGNRHRASLFKPSEKPGWHGYYDLAETWPEWEPEGELVGWFQSE